VAAGGHDGAGAGTDLYANAAGWGGALVEAVPKQALGFQLPFCDSGRP